MTRRPPKPLTVKELEQIKVLKASGKTYHAIAVDINRDPKTVKKACLEPQTAHEIQVIKEELVDMFEQLGKRMLSSITEDDIRKISSYQRTISAGICTDKMRLLRDESTANIDVHTQITNLDNKISEIKALEDKLDARIAELKAADDNE